MGTDEKDTGKIGTLLWVSFAICFLCISPQDLYQLDVSLFTSGCE